MMEKKHTQGKWEVIEHGSDFESTIQTEGGLRIAEVKSFPRGFNDAPLNERVANAKLIASAPEMLEMLIQLRDSKHIVITGSEWTELDLLIKQATE